MEGEKMAQASVGDEANAQLAYVAIKKMVETTR